MTKHDELTELMKQVDSIIDDPAYMGVKPADIISLIQKDMLEGVVEVASNLLNEDSRLDDTWDNGWDEALKELIESIREHYGE
jgi:hypothetical protein